MVIHVLIIQYHLYNAKCHQRLTSSRHDHCILHSYRLQSLKGNTWGLTRRRIHEYHWGKSEDPLFQQVSHIHGKGAALVIVNPSRQKFSLSFKLSFPCTINEHEYEAAIIGLLIIWDMEAKRVRLLEDFAVVIQQIKREFIVTRLALDLCRTLV